MTRERSFLVVGNSANVNEVDKMATNKKPSTKALPERAAQAVPAEATSKPILTLAAETAAILEAVIPSRPALVEVEQQNAATGSAAPATESPPPAVARILDGPVESVVAKVCEPKIYGTKRTLPYEQAGEMPFSFIVNKNSLLFDVRLAGLRRLRSGRTKLATAVGEVNENGTGELTIRIGDPAQARRVLVHVFRDGGYRELRVKMREPATPVSSAPPQAPQNRGIITSTPRGVLNELFDKAVAAISQAYQRLGHSMGWRFLMGPKATLSSAMEIALITLNPGGNGNPLGHPSASREEGNAYFDETWPGHAPGSAPLQRQIRALFGMLQQHIADERPLAEFMNTGILTGYFVPFRSPDFARLHARQESLRFARDLWIQILSVWTPKLIITIDRETYASLGTILQQRPGCVQLEHRAWPSGWGKYTCDSSRFGGIRPDAYVTVARLPHLSRFGLFGRAPPGTTYPSAPTDVVPPLPRPNESSILPTSDVKVR
jgi:hypothetical protein